MCSLCEDKLVVSWIFTIERDFKYQCRGAGLPEREHWKLAQTIIHCHEDTAGYSHLKHKHMRKTYISNEVDNFCWFYTYDLWIKIYSDISALLLYVAYLSLEVDRGGLHSCLPSRLQLCSSTPVWSRFGTRRCHTSWHHLDYSSTPFFPQRQKQREAEAQQVWLPYLL